MNAPAQQPLTRNEYRVLVEQSPLLIWRANTDAACDYFNERWLAFTGRSLQQEVGNGWAQGVHPDDFDRCLEIYLGSFGRREIFEMEYRLQRYDGEFRWLFDRGVPFFGDDGVFGGYVGSCIDIHEQVTARETLLRSKEEEIKTLQGLLPICSNCHKIRDEAGQWHPLEHYIQERSRASFTHGICKDCLKALYPQWRK